MGSTQQKKKLKGISILGAYILKVVNRKVRRGARSM